MKNASKPMGPPPRQITPAPTELTQLETGFSTPSLRKRSANPEPELLMNRKERRALKVDTLPTTILPAVVSATATSTTTSTTTTITPTTNPTTVPTPTVPSVISTPTGATPHGAPVTDPSILLKLSLELAESLEKELDAHEAIEREAVRAKAKSDEGPSPDSFPFAPDKLGRWASKQRKNGNEWVGKANGHSVAGTLQCTLDKLRADNADRIDHKACGYLQELLGLLPAGVNRQGKTFNYMLMKSFYSIGLTHAQWNAIEQLLKRFDELDTRSDPQGSQTFKKLLVEIVAAKNGLMHLQKQAAKARNEVKS